MDKLPSELICQIAKHITDVKDFLHFSGSSRTCQIACERIKFPRQYIILEYDNEGSILDVPRNTGALGQRIEFTQIDSHTIKQTVHRELKLRSTFIIKCPQPTTFKEYAYDRFAREITRIRINEIICRPACVELSEAEDLYFRKLFEEFRGSCGCFWIRCWNIEQIILLATAIKTDDYRLRLMTEVPAVLPEIQNVSNCDFVDLEFLTIENLSTMVLRPMRCLWITFAPCDVTLATVEKFVNNFKNGLMPLKSLRVCDLQIDREEIEEFAKRHKAEIRTWQRGVDHFVWWFTITYSNPAGDVAELYCSICDMGQNNVKTMFRFTRPIRKIRRLSDSD